MGYTIKSVPCDVLYFINDDTGEYTFTSLAKGGPIITAMSLEEGKKKFEEALDLANAIHNLLYYRDQETKKVFSPKKRSKLKGNNTINFVSAHSI